MQDHHTSEVKLQQKPFGSFTDKTTGKVSDVWSFIWQTTSNISVEVITYGATIRTIKMPDKTGTIKDIVMGFNDMQGYLNPLNPYFGATIGRVANRIGNAQVTIAGTTYSVTANLGKHQLHGGLKGFDKVNWDYFLNGTKLVLSYYSKDGEEGYPGDVLVQATFELTHDNQFKVKYTATSSQPTVINLTNHSYFNLAGHNAGAQELYKHQITINADATTEVDKDSIPSGKLLDVANTIFDLRVPKVLGEVIHKIPGYDGFDHNFCITKGSEQENTFIARAVHPPSGRVLEVYSNQPGVQFYNSNFIPEDPKKDKNAKTLEGKDGLYFKHGAFCLETQNYPDAINHNDFPSALLNPGETYEHTVNYKFLLID